MTRAQRFGALASVSSLIYVLLALSVIPFPLVSKETSDQLVPVVRYDEWMDRLAVTLWPVGSNAY